MVATRYGHGREKQRGDNVRIDKQLYELFLLYLGLDMIKGVNVRAFDSTVITVVVHS